MSLPSGDFVMRDGNTVNESESAESWIKKISLLEKEIDQLEDRLREHQDKVCIVNKKELPELIKQVLSSTEYEESTKHSIQRRQMEIENLNDQLDVNQTLTNIYITTAKSHLKEQDESSVVRQHNLSGTCGKLTFSLKYSVKESMIPEEPGAEILHLQLDVNEDIANGFSPALSRLEETRDIQGFFSFLQSLSSQIELRHNTFKDMKKTFQENVEISVKGDKPQLIISNKEIPGECWTIFWELVVTSLYQVIPKIYLTVELPMNSGGTSEVGEIAEALPETFQTMLKEQDIDSAMRNIVHLAIDRDMQ